MFKKILYPTDFSDVSKKALDYIRQLREGGLEEVTVLHVIDERGIEAMERYAPMSANEFQLRMTSQMKDELQNVEEELKKMGLRVTLRLEVGIPIREILKLEKEKDVSVIVIGSHGRSNLEEMFLGSVSEKVIRKCEKPVFVVKR
jgi:nucleotide-binding universal stress UspA family protein